jgi:hypothetical protein
MAMDFVHRTEPNAVTTDEFEIVEITLLLTRGQAAALARATGPSGLTVGQFIRRAIDDFFRRCEDGAGDARRKGVKYSPLCRSEAGHEV